MSIYDQMTQEEHVAKWTARAIYSAHRTNYRIELLPDRQWVENVGQEFLEWINDRALPWLEKEARRRDMTWDSPERVVLSEGRFRLEATPARSYGYLYIGAIDRGEEETKQEDTDQDETAGRGSTEAERQDDDAVDGETRGTDQAAGGITEEGQ